MAAVALEVEARRAGASAALCERLRARLSPLERLYWYPAVLEALGRLECPEPEAASAAQGLLLAIALDLEDGCGAGAAAPGPAAVAG